MNGIGQILASMPKEKLLAMGKSVVSSIANKQQIGQEQTGQTQHQCAGSKFYHPSSDKGIGGILNFLGGK